MRRFLVVYVLVFAFVKVGSSAETNDIDVRQPKSDGPPINIIDQILSYGFTLDDSPDVNPLEALFPNDEKALPKKLDTPFETKIVQLDQMNLPEAMNPEAAFAPILQLIQNSLMNIPSPIGDAPNILMSLTSPPNNDETVNVKTVEHLPGGMKVKVIRRTYSPPMQTFLTAGNINGQNMNNFQQKQMYSTHNFAVLQPDKGTPKSEEVPLKIEEMLTKKDEKKSDDNEAIPKDIIEDLATMVKLTDDIAYQLQ